MTRAGYSWAGGLEFDALTATWISHAGEPADVFRAVGATWEPAPRSTFAETVDLVDGYDANREPLLVDLWDEWLVLVARGGYEFTRPEVAARASKLGRVVTVSWDVNGVMSFVVADDGQITRHVDDAVFIDTVAGEPLPEEAGLDFGDEPPPPQADLLVLAERLTGVRLTPEWLRQPREAAVVHGPT